MADEAIVSMALKKPRLIDLSRIKTTILVTFEQVVLDLNASKHFDLDVDDFAVGRASGLKDLIRAEGEMLGDEIKQLTAPPTRHAEATRAFITHVVDAV